MYFGHFYLIRSSFLTNKSLFTVKEINHLIFPLKATRFRKEALLSSDFNRTYESKNVQG